MTNIQIITRLLLYFASFGFSFYCLSGLDLSRLMLNSPERNTKATLLLVFMSLALGFLVAQFIIAITSLY